MTEAERQEVAELAADLGAELRFQQPLAELTTWKIGGPAEAVFSPPSEAAVVAILALAHRAGWPLRVLGNGSNLLCPDEGVAGVVVRLAGALTHTRLEGARLTAEAGAFLPRLARETAAAGLSGLECVGGVPGTVGGGCLMNAGIPGGTLGDVLDQLRVLRPDRSVVTWRRDELALGHRDSRLRHEAGIVLAATFELRPDDPHDVEARLAKHLEYRRRTQPLNQPTCGSVFRRPAPDVPPGRLLEAAGCKGLRRSGAEVSSLHANWIVNLGGATAADVRWLMDEMRRRVLAAHGVELIAEVAVW
ncbi:MAG: UDP-N-acetylmuramate dehydrogenase [Armatimonadetes bacterium]|nr:UDP-N-acetylmuramate dehydrogenase [Armatimonadota bacterium]